MKNRNPQQLVDFEKRIKQELKTGSYIGGFFLGHNYIEAYMKEILFILTANNDLKGIKVIEKLISEKSYKNISLILKDNKIISILLYNQIDGINNTRNKLSHDIISVQINSEKFKEKCNKKAKLCINICNSLVSIYEKIGEENVNALIKNE